VRRNPSLWLVAAVLLLIVYLTWKQYPAPGPSPASTTASAPATPSAPTPPPAAESAPTESRDLSIDEKRGGHTLARHVGRTDEQLRDRLRREPNISAASTYTGRAIAERTVARALARNQSEVAKWLARTGQRTNLSFDYRGVTDEPIGRSIRRGQSTSVPCIDAIVVLRWIERDRYFVLTSYPEIRR
jgi:hypothetical protein